MNSYIFGINGSWWLLGGLIALAVIFTIFTYRYTVPPIGRTKKTVLISLRSLALALLLFIIFEPVVTMVSGHEVPPRLAVLMDKSLSIAHDDNSGSRREIVGQLMNDLALSDYSEDELVYIEYDNDIYRRPSFNKDSLRLDGPRTDMSRPLKWVAANMEDMNIRAVMMISDGSYNTGDNPIYDADILGIPVYTIGIGDSLAPRDISINSILTNDIVYMENPVPVNINIKSSEYDKGTIEVKLLDNGKEIGSQEINLHPDKSDFTCIFEFDPESDGQHRLTAKVTEMDGELTTKNNSKSEFIRVMKNKRRYSIIAGAPSPDLSFIRNSLASGKGIEVTAYVQKSATEFYDKAPTAIDLRESDMLVLIGFPVRNSSQVIINMIAQALEDGKPLLFVASEATNFAKLKPLEKYLPFSAVSSSPAEFTAFADIRPEALSSPLLRVYGTEKDIDYWNSLPPLFKTETFVKPRSGAEVVSYMRVNNVLVEEPVILTRSAGLHKSAAVMAYGMYRWKLTGYAADIAQGRSDAVDVFDIFIENTSRWLTADIKKKLVDVKTSRQFYDNSEKIEFLASVYDAAYTPIENATVSINVSSRTDEQQQSRELILSNMGAGRYSGQLNPMPQAVYNYDGTATVSGRQHGSDKGKFEVGQLSVEYQDLQMHPELLRTISSRTGARFITPEGANGIIDEIQNRDDYVPQSISQETDFALWNYALLLALAILLFSTEWFLRKKAGLL